MLAVFSPGGRKRGESESWVWGKEKTHRRRSRHTPPRPGEGPQQEVVNGWTVTEPQEAATDREGTGRLRPRLSSSQSPGLSYKEAFPGLNPLLVWGWRGSDSFLPHPHPCIRAQAWHKGGTRAAGPVPQSLDKPSPAPSLLSTVRLWRHRVKGHLVPLLKGYKQADSLPKLYRTAGHIKLNGGGHSALGSLDREWQIRQEEQTPPSMPAPHMDQHPTHWCFLCARPPARQAT